MINLKKMFVCLFISLFVITGCGKDEDHFEVARKNMSELNNYSVDMNMIIGMKTGGVSIEIPISFEADIDVKNKVTKVFMSIDDFLGVDAESFGYIDSSDADNIVQYQSSDGDNWTKTISNDYNGVESFIDVFDAKEIESDDKDYYVYEVTMKKEKFLDQIESNLESSDVSARVDISDDIVFKYYVNKETKYIDKAVANLEDLIDITSNDSTAKVYLTKLYLEINFSNFNELGLVEIPDDVINSVDSENVANMI